MGDATQAAYGVGYSLAAFPFGATFALLLTLAVYARGWRALGETRPEQIPLWRAASFAAGIATVWVALASPLDALSGVLLTAHMVQHLLLMSIAPPLLVLGEPVVPMLRGLPRFVVREGIGPFFTLKPVHGLQKLFASRVFAWLVMNVTFLGWHTPAMYGMALRSPGWHEVEHVCFLLASVLFWWHIIAPWPTVYAASRWLLLPFLLSADLVNTALSASLAFSGKVFYQQYAQVPRFFGLSVMDDQVAAGSLMWVVGSVSFLGAAMLTAVALLSRKGERRKAEAEAARDRLTALRRAERPVVAARPATPGPGRFDLFSIKPIAAFFKLRYGRQSLQAVSLVIAAGLIADGLFGPRMGAMNLAGIVPWTFARAVFVMALLLVGNLFCMSCPFTLPRELSKWVARRFGLAQLPWPRALRNKWVPIGLVVVFFWAFTAMDLWNAPARTAVLLLAYFAVTFAVDTVFRGASFCKYVCPLGQFNFVSSLLSPVGVAAREPATCGSCTTRDCIAGHEAPKPQRGCELHLFMPAKQGNLDCTLCMDCVKACPHDNIGLFVQPPAMELVQLSVSDPQRSAVGRYRDRLDLAVLAVTVVAAGFANAAVMVEPVTALMDRAGRGFSTVAGGTLGFAAAAALPALLVGLLWLAMPGGLGPKRWTALPKWGLALLPVGLGMWAAHLVFHILTGWGALVPGLLEAGHGLARLGLPLAHLPAPDWTSEHPLVGVASILPIQLGILDVGLLGTLYVGWRLASARLETARRALALLPWASVVGALYAAGVWILLQPMQMRGMAGM